MKTSSSFSGEGQRNSGMIAESTPGADVVLWLRWNGGSGNEYRLACLCKRDEFALPVISESDGQANRPTAGLELFSTAPGVWSWSNLRKEVNCTDGSLCKATMGLTWVGVWLRNERRFLPDGRSFGVDRELRSLFVGFVVGCCCCCLVNFNGGVAGALVNELNTVSSMLPPRQSPKLGRNLPGKEKKRIDSNIADPVKKKRELDNRSEMIRQQKKTEGKTNPLLTTKASMTKTWLMRPCS